MAKAEPTYQDLQARLDEILVKLQTDELDADAAVALYEQGLDLVKQLEDKLASAENKVAKLKADSAKK